MTYQRPAWKTSPYGSSLPLAGPAAPGGVGDAHRLLVPGRFGEHQQHLDAGRGGLADRCGEVHGVQQRIDPPGEDGRQYPADLRGGALGGRAFGGDQPCPGSGDEPEQDGNRLLVGEHEWRQLVSGREPVPAVATAPGLDRDAEVGEVRRVAADRALVDAQPTGQVSHGEAATGLEDLQQRQYARGGPGQ